MSLKDKTNFRESPHLYELIDPDGKLRGTFPTAKEAGDTAKRIWPGLEEGASDGWNVQVAGVR